MEVCHVCQYAVDDGDQLGVVLLKGPPLSHVFDDIIQ